MKRSLGYQWHLRPLMAQRGMFSTTDLVPLLAERGVDLSAAQTYRLVAKTPERLSLRTLVALCDILGCGPSDLIEPVVEQPKAKAVAAASRTPTAVKGRTPRAAEVHKKP